MRTFLGRARFAKLWISVCVFMIVNPGKHSLSALAEANFIVMGQPSSFCYNCFLMHGQQIEGKDMNISHTHFWQQTLCYAMTKLSEGLHKFLVTKPENGPIILNYFSVCSL